MSNTAIATKEEHSASVSRGDECPPVVILNLFYSGLGIARDMAATGARVIGLSAHRRIYGNYTRCCEVRLAPNSQEQPEELAEFLLELARSIGRAVIFPTRDADVLFLDTFRNELEPWYRLAIPPRQVLLRVMDKHALVQAAATAGVPVPRTMLAVSDSDLMRVAHEVGFPCVIKPVSSVHWRRGNNWDLVGGRKGFRADSLAELQREYARVAQVRPEVLIQEWIPGPVEEIVVLGGYVGDKCEPLAYFTARKIVQSPEECGTGCVVESEHLPELVNPTLRLFRTLRYEGMAEVEYKRDARDGEFKLIEINTRHWDWHQLGRQSGINLTQVAYGHLSGRPAAVAPKPTRRCKWIAEDAFFTYVAAGVHARKLSIRTLRRQISGKRMYGIFSWRDPMPWLRYSVCALLPAWFRAARGKLWGPSPAHKDEAKRRDCVEGCQ